MRAIDRQLARTSPVPRAQHAEVFEGLECAEIIPVRGKKYLVRDFTQGMPRPSRWWEFRRKLSAALGQLGPLDVGRYNEMRGNMYDTLAESVPVVDDGAAAWGGMRNIHIGVDIGAAVGTPVRSFAQGKIHTFGYNPGAGDYGHVVVVEHTFKGVGVWALYGHLGGASMHGKYVGQPIERGEVLGFLGAPSENGGWPSHVHFQLSLLPPPTHDMPGVVSRKVRAIPGGVQQRIRPCLLFFLSPTMSAREYR